MENGLFIDGLPIKKLLFSMAMVIYWGDEGDVSWEWDNNPLDIYPLDPIFPTSSISMFHLVGGIPAPLKNIKVKWEYSQLNGKITFMFQTTNQ